jgi:hypothetical protein
MSRKIGKCLAPHRPRHILILDLVVCDDDQRRGKKRSAAAALLSQARCQVPMARSSPTSSVSNARDYGFAHDCPLCPKCHMDVLTASTVCTNDQSRASMIGEVGNPAQYLAGIGDQFASPALPDLVPGYENVDNNALGDSAAQEPKRQASEQQHDHLTTNTAIRTLPVTTASTVSNESNQRLATNRRPATLEKTQDFTDSRSKSLQRSYRPSPAAPFK